MEEAYSPPMDGRASGSETVSPVRLMARSGFGAFFMGDMMSLPTTMVAGWPPGGTGNGIAAILNLGVVSPRRRVAAAAAVSPTAIPSNDQPGMRPMTPSTNNW